MSLYSNTALSQKLERTEACANKEFICARLKMFPNSNAAWLDFKGTYAMFDGIESPLTQTFGLGLFAPLTHADLETIETFYNKFSAPVFHEVSPMADPSSIAILSERGYQPVESTSVLYKPLAEPSFIHTKVTSRKMTSGEEKLWSAINVKGWNIPEFTEFLNQFSQIGASSVGANPFFAELNGKPISTGLLYIYDKIALLAGDSTIPEGRNHGGQSSLIAARLNDAIAQGCSLAMIAASPGSQSQQNAEKRGFRIAYTRTKWKLCSR